MATCWHIVPITDGCTLLCRDSQGNFYLSRKENDNKQDELTFSTEEEAQTYINDWVAPHDYKPEKFWILEYKSDSSLKLII